MVFAAGSLIMLADSSVCAPRYKFSENINQAMPGQDHFLVRAFEGTAKALVNLASNNEGKGSTRVLLAKYNRDQRMSTWLSINNQVSIVTRRDLQVTLIAK